MNLAASHCVHYVLSSSIQGPFLKKTVVRNNIFSLQLDGISCVMVCTRQDKTHEVMSARFNQSAFNNINRQLDETTTNFIDNYNQINMFRAIISPVLRSSRLCLHLVV